MPQTAPVPLPPYAALTDEPIYRLTLEQYHEMARSGTLTSDDRVELLEGLLVCKMTKLPPHEYARHVLPDLLRPLLSEGWSVMVERPITLPRSHSEPEPDIIIVRGDPRDYRDRHPGPEDVAWIAEVADSSLKRDRTTKLRLYAEAGVGVYWIVNLMDRCVEVYTEPLPEATPPAYAKRRVVAATAEASVKIGGRTRGHIRIGDLLT